MTFSIESTDVRDFAADLRSVRWEPPFRDALDESGIELLARARMGASGAGGAAPLTAATLTVQTTSDQVEAKASAPYAAGSEFGSGGGNPKTRQFSRRPGPNRSDGHWFGPALEESGAGVVRNYDDAVVHATRPVFR